jgi:hypothetical protein
LLTADRPSVTERAISGVSSASASARRMRTSLSTGSLVCSSSATMVITGVVSTRTSPRPRISITSDGLGLMKASMPPL